MTYHPIALHVISCWGRDFVHVTNTAEAFSVRQCSVLDKSLEDHPAPFTVLIIVGDPPHIEKTLVKLGPLQIVEIRDVNVKVHPPFRVRILS